MNKIIALFCLFLTACVAPAFRPALDPEEKVISFTEQHTKSKAEAYRAAHLWIAKNYKGGKEVIHVTDEQSGTLVAKGAYGWAIPVDPPINSLFWRGFIPYSLTVMVKDNKAKIDFETGANEPATHDPGDLRFSGQYWPKDKMPNLISHYQSIKNDILHAINQSSQDF